MFFHFLAQESWIFLPPIRAAIHIILVNKNEKPGNWILPLCLSWHRSLLAHYLPEHPLKTLVFSLLPAHFSPLCSFLLFRKVLFLAPWLCLHLFSLTNCRGDFFILAPKYSPPRNISGEKKVWHTQFNRNIPIHFTLYCIFSSHSLFWRSHISYHSHLFPSFTHWAPDALTHHWHPLPSAAFPSFPLSAGTPPYLAAACFTSPCTSPAPPAYTCTGCRFLLRQNLRILPTPLPP